MAAALPFSAPSWLTIGDTPLQVYEWNCTRPTYGSIGSFSAVTSTEMLNAAGLDLYALGQKAYVAKGQKGQIPVHIRARYNGGVVDLFGGELDNVSWNFDEDEVTITGRDWAGILADILRPMSAQQALGPLATGTAPTGALSAAYNAGSPFNKQIQNFTPSKVAYLWATTYGFKPEIYTTKGMLNYGQITRDLTIDAGNVRTVWAELQAMARVVGWVCYVTPGHALYFGPPVTNKPALNISWNTTPPQGMFPANNFEIDYNPRRNKNFLVVMSSYHMAMQTTSQAAVGVVSSEMQAEFANAPSITVTPQGFVFATTGAKNTASIAEIFSNYGLPVYAYHCQADLTPEQLQSDAYSKALDIAKRELILTARIDGNPEAEPLLQIKVHAPTVPGGLTKRPFYVNSIEHSFTMDDGWYTTIHGWTLPPPTESILYKTTSIGAPATVPQAKPYTPDMP